MDAIMASSTVELYQAIFAASTAIAGFILPYIPILTYVQYAAPRPDVLMRPPIVRTLRITIWISVGFFVYNSLVIGMSLVGLLKDVAYLAAITVTFFYH
jgi:hypothetical protein